MSRTLPLLVSAAGLFMAGCLGHPESVQPVSGFDSNRYLGTWYEIARLDHSFERGLDNVSATYSMRDDGGIKVLNRGFKEKKDRWSSATGKAFFVEDESTGYLKVSFFGPFYGSYVVFDLDEDYQQAWVSGSSEKYLWLLSRTPTVPEDDKKRFTRIAKEKGFQVEDLIWVDQGQAKRTETSPE